MNNNLTLEQMELIKLQFELIELFPYTYNIDDLELKDLSLEILVYNFTEYIKDYEKNIKDNNLYMEKMPEEDIIYNVKIQLKNIELNGGL